jgi:hypothetical protein
MALNLLETYGLLYIALEWCMFLRALDAVGPVNDL